MSAKSNNSSKTVGLNDPFKEKTWDKAAKIVQDYNLVIHKNDELGFVGSSLEMPTVFADGKSASKCFSATLEALTVAAGAMIEAGKEPPQAASADKRNVQINIRVNNQEKLLLSRASTQFGYKGLSDFIRSSALEKLHCLNIA